MSCGVFLYQGLNLCPLHWWAGSYPLCHQGSPTVQELLCVCVCVSAKLYKNSGQIWHTHCILWTSALDYDFSTRSWTECSVDSPGHGWALGNLGGVERTSEFSFLGPLETEALGQGEG